MARTSVTVGARAFGLLVSFSAVATGLSLVSSGILKQIQPYPAAARIPYDWTLDARVGLVDGLCAIEVLVGVVFILRIRSLVLGIFGTLFCACLGVGAALNRSYGVEGCGCYGAFDAPAVVIWGTAWLGVFSGVAQMAGGTYYRARRVGTRQAMTATLGVLALFCGSRAARPSPPENAIGELLALGNSALNQHETMIVVGASSCPKCHAVIDRILEAKTALIRDGRLSVLQVLRTSEHNAMPHSWHGVGRLFVSDHLWWHLIEKEAPRVVSVTPHSVRDVEFESW